MYKNKADNGRNNISGLNIRSLRKSMPIKTSQRALAYKAQLYGLDIDKNAIQRIESGERFVTDIELRVFASIFGVSADDLLKSFNEEDSIQTSFRENLEETSKG